jgi:hypothetical protein
MKYCPSCRNEFDDAAARCPKCDEDLVGSIEELERIGKSVVYLGVNVADAEFVLEVLKTHDIQAALDTQNIFGRGPEAVVVPYELAGKAADLLDSSGIVIEEDEESPNTVMPGQGCSCDTKLVTVATFQSAPEADPLKGVLEANGIPAFLENEHASQALPLTGVAIPVILKIPSNYAHAAAKVLREFEEVAPGHYGREKYTDHVVKTTPGYYLLVIILFPFFVIYWLVTLPKRLLDGNTGENEDKDKQ